MNNFTILMYEDDEQYKDSFEYNLKPKVQAKGKVLKIHHKLNGDTIEQDLTLCIPNLILIDHDLGTITGDELIEILDNMPEQNEVILMYYSGGETLEDLKSTASRFRCHVQCYTKEGSDLEEAILRLVK
ncbi:hypothetical protein HZP28_16030 [Elizabethkingia anophelis]|nr:hypothetical protein [Elizabethkingia anophelis]MCT4274281.1 hypothetical protein [Elizabethkingia anophelis]MCT4291850.1 hypothetical protein [Elizabethkingia anophelis]